jgi:hypothetical protein
VDELVAEELVAGAADELFWAMSAADAGGAPRSPSSVPTAAATIGKRRTAGNRIDHRRLDNVGRDAIPGRS